MRRYRHPVRRRLRQIPAGLLDFTFESAVQAAERELADEGHTRAAELYTLADTLNSPGTSDETVRILLAGDLTYIPASAR